ncbi:MAG: hypothetical protein HC866_17870 [Leptolyngbyaceae cyanobacterium RU_5_1]|nr:hypothetical protein [Leptolyngbyaceae cyanobacterium RU_5_1]
MKRLQVGDLLIELLDMEPAYSSMTDAQSETYRLMLALASITGNKPVNFVEFETFLALLQISRPEPFLKRLDNLQESGRLRFHYCFQLVAA